MRIRNDEKQKHEGFAGYPIGAVSIRVNLSQKTIRDYEKMGLIKPKRDRRTNNRIYSDFDVAQIQRITHLIHHEGLTLPCIRRLLQLAPCWNIFDCDVKENCPAHRNAARPCYETRGKEGTLCSGDCEQCAIYLSRTPTPERILVGPYAREK
jgi:hypothetical protein